MTNKPLKAAVSTAALLAIGWTTFAIVWAACWALDIIVVSPAAKRWTARRRTDAFPR